MTRIAVYTIVDITATGVTNNNTENQFERNQQRNWETVNQIINLRVESTVEAVPKTPMNVNTENHDFGAYYKGYHQCWKFIFSPNTDNVRDYLDKLSFDFDNVPVVSGLNETIDMPYPIFSTIGALKNTYFKVL